jgi:hypothetical protein
LPSRTLDRVDNPGQCRLLDDDETFRNGIARIPIRREGTLQHLPMSIGRRFGSSDEQNARIAGPAHAFGRRRPDVPRDADRRPGLQRHPGARRPGTVEDLRHFERQHRKLGGRQHDAKLRERIRSLGLGVERAGQSGNGRQDSRDLVTGAIERRFTPEGVAFRDYTVVEIGEPLFHVAVLVGQRYTPCGRIAADAEVERQWRQQLVMPRSRAQQLDAHRPDVHHGLFSLRN